MLRAPHTRSGCIPLSPTELMNGWLRRYTDQVSSGDRWLLCRWTGPACAVTPLLAVICLCSRFLAVVCLQNDTPQE